SSADCSTGGVAGTPVALNGSGVADPSQTAVQSVGGVSLTAHYNGSNSYNESASSCVQLSPVKLDSSSTTAIHNANHAVITSAAIGSTVHDSATVTGTPDGETLSLHDALPIYSSADCSTGGVAGTPVALNGSGVADPSQTAVQSVG